MSELGGSGHGIGLILAWYFYTAWYAGRVLVPRLLEAA